MSDSKKISLTVSASYSKTKKDESVELVKRLPDHRILIKYSNGYQESLPKYAFLDF